MNITDDTQKCCKHKLENLQPAGKSQARQNVLIKKNTVEMEI